MDAWWPSIVTALITGGLAFAGIAYSQRKTKSREFRSWMREQRRSAHTAFLAEQRRLDDQMMRVTRIGNEPPMSESWYQALGALLIGVEVFGSRDAALAARRLYRVTLELDSGSVGSMVEVEQAAAEYQRWVQLDLDIPPTAVPPWALEDTFP